MTRGSFYGYGFAPPTFVVKDGVCYVEGLITGGPFDPSKAITRLPYYCHPKGRLVFNLSQGNHNNHASTCRVDVLSNGDITWSGGGNDHGWISLTGITFAIDETKKMSSDLREWITAGKLPLHSALLNNGATVYSEFTTSSSTIAKQGAELAAISSTLKSLLSPNGLGGALELLLERSSASPSEDFPDNGVMAEAVDWLTTQFHAAGHSRPG